MASLPEQGMWPCLFTESDTTGEKDFEEFFTDKEVSAQLKLSRRTLQDYRNEGRISYYQLGGKILYRESDIEKMLQESYREAYMSSK